MRLTRPLLAAAAVLPLLGACTEIEIRDDGSTASAPAPAEDPATLKALDALGYSIRIYYSDQQGLLPSDLAALVPAYIAAIPADGVTGSTRQVEDYDGSGGWVYSRQDGRICPNLPGSAPDGRPWRSHCTDSLKPNP